MATLYKEIGAQNRRVTKKSIFKKFTDFETPP
jgi:hypothetical protein